MKKISCEIKLLIDGKEQKESEIIELIKSPEMTKYSIDYGADVICNKEYKNSTLNKVKIKTENSISDEIKGSGIYFILSSEEDKLLYIGKAKDLKDRLKRHLIECGTSTHSHIEDVYNYLLNEKNQKRLLQIKYGVINSDNGNNAAIEGALIDYILSMRGKYPFLDSCWNIRED